MVKDKDLNYTMAIPQAFTAEQFTQWAAAQEAVMMNMREQQQQQMTQFGEVLTGISRVLQSNAGMKGDGKGARLGGIKKTLVEQARKAVETFKGTDFTDWKFRTQMTMISIDPNMKKFFELVAQCDDDIENVDQVFQGQPECKDLSSHWYFVLAQRTEGEAFDIVKNVPDSNGAAAWQKLLRRYDGKSMGKQVQLLRRVVNPGRVKKMGDLMAAIEKW